MTNTLSSARRRRETRLDFCAAIMIYQQQHGDLSAPKAFEAIRDKVGCPFDSAAEPFHAYELFLSRNREQVRVRFVDFCTKQAESTGLSDIDRGALERRPDVSIVDLRATEERELSEDDRRFIDDAVAAILARPREAKKIIRDHVIKNYT